MEATRLDGSDGTSLDTMLGFYATKIANASTVESIAREAYTSSSVSEPEFL